MNEALQSAVITGPTGAVGLALCRELQCQPGDLLEFVDGPKAAE